MIDPLYIFKKEIRRFDGWSLLLLVVFLPAFILGPEYMLGVLFGVPVISISPAWIDITLRIILAVFTTFSIRDRMYRANPSESARLSVAAIALAISGFILIALQIGDVIDLIPS